MNSFGNDASPLKSFLGYIIFLIVGGAISLIPLTLLGLIAFDTSLSLVTVCILLCILTMAYGFISGNATYSALGLLPGVIAVIAVICFSTILKTEEHRNLIGEVPELNFSEEVEHIDLKELPTIDIEVARKLADKKLGEISSLGSQVTIGELTLQSLNGQLYYVAPLEHTSFFKWLSNKEGTPGYIKVSATNQSDVQLVTELNGQPLKLKYLDSAYFGSNLKLKAYFGDMKKLHTDYTFELDDEGTPYWVITRYDTAIGVNEKKAVGTLILNSQTGEYNIYDIENTPEWVDRIQPASYISNYIDKWGGLVHGVFNFSDKDKLKATDGMNIIYNNGRCYYYTGITSVGSDDSLVGFILTDTRTSKSTFYKVSGATESAAKKAAAGSVQQFGYQANFPYLINVQNEPTYFMALKDDNGLIKQYAMVNVKNYNIVGIGDSLQTTLNKYIDGLTATNVSLSGANNTEEVTGVIDRIGLVIKDGLSFYDITLQGSDTVFTVSTEVSRKVALSKTGDSVKITYIPLNNGTTILANTFEKN